MCPFVFVFRVVHLKKKIMREKRFTESVRLRCRKTDLEGIDRLCAALGTNRSAFLREKIENILSTLNLKNYAETRI